MALALNNLQRVDMPLNKETNQPNQPTRHAGHCWKSRDELISNILLWTPSHRRTKAGRPARTYLQQLYGDTGCSLEDLPGTMDYRDWWRERVREICAASATWWWWCHLSAVKPGTLSSIFLTTSSFFWFSSLVYFKNGPEYLTRKTAQVCIPLMRFLLESLISNSLFFLSFVRGTLFLYFRWSPLLWWCPLPIFPSNCIFSFLLYSGLYHVTSGISKV